MSQLTVSGNAGWRETRAGPWERTSGNSSAIKCDCPCSDTNLAMCALATRVLQLLCFISPHELRAQCSVLHFKLMPALLAKCLPLKTLNSR